MRKRLILFFMIIVLIGITIAEYYICFEPNAADSDKKAAFIVGLVLTTTDDDWSDQLQYVIQDSIVDAGGEIISIPTLRTQEDQITSLRSLIVYQVDIIIFSPVIETGWDSVYAEADAAKIPIISLAKSVKLSSEDMNVHYVGYDYYQAAAELTGRMLAQCSEDTVVMELFGTLQADSTRRISRGFRDTLNQMEQHDNPYTVCCDFMRSRAFQAVDTFFSAGKKMNVIFSQGDPMTFGAISALQKNGYEPGKDVLIFAVGGSEESVQLAKEGKINCLMQCDLEKMGDLTVQAIQLLLDNSEHEPITFLADTILISG